MSARRRATYVACVVLTAGVAGCGFPTQRDATPVVEDRPPSFVSDGEEPSQAKESATLWFVADEALRPVSRRLAAPVDATTVLTALLDGVTPSESARSLRSALPSGGMVRSVTTSGGRAVVDLATEFADIPTGDQLLALAQIVYSLTDLRGIGRVRFTVDEVPVVVPLPSGESTEDSVSRDDFAALEAG